jgi:hypothetical protein
MEIPLSGPPVRTPNLLSQTPTAQFGKDIDKVESPPPGGGGTPEHPFQIQRVDADTVNVRYGTCQDIEPTDVATDIDLTGSNTHTFYLDVEVDIDGIVVAVTLSHGTSGRPADTDYHGYITLGTVVTASAVITVINQAATHSLRVAMCGRVVDTGVLTVRGTYEFWGF